MTLEQVEAKPVRCPDPAAAAKMIALIEEVRKDQDSIGGVCELVAVGVPPGLGEPVFDKLKADLAKALLSLPAVMAFEYGAGFAVATHARQREQRRCSSRKDGGKIGTETNRHGGMLGGISSGEPIVCRVAIKPTSSLPRPQQTVTRAGEPTEIVTKGRHDPVPAAALRADGRGDDGAGAGRSLAAPQDRAGRFLNVMEHRVDDHNSEEGEAVAAWFKVRSHARRIGFQPVRSLRDRLETYPTGV